MSPKRNIEIVAENCVGCLNCQLICSLTFTRRFNPAEAYIKINRTPSGNEVSFTEDCTGCGVCVGYCVFDTLTFGEGG